MNRAVSQVETQSELLSLIYELLDAHTDTLVLGAELVDELRWGAHLDYLRALQRISRELVARWYATPRLSDQR